jgi:hypothetical protein
VHYIEEDLEGDWLTDWLEEFDSWLALHAAFAAWCEEHHRV